MSKDFVNKLEGITRQLDYIAPRCLCSGKRSITRLLMPAVMLGQRRFCLSLLNTLNSKRLICFKPQ